MFSLYFDFYEKIVWVAVIIFIIVGIICRQNPLRKLGGIGQPLPNPICLILPMVFFVLMAGFRKNVGDTPYYVISFEAFDSNNLPGVTAELFFTEMFQFFQILLRHLTDDGTWLSMFSAVFALPVPLIIMYKYAYPFQYTIFLFVAYGYFGGMMNGMRQYMAAAITLLGTRYLFSLKWGSFIKYAAIIMLGWGMHHSALILIPIYFVVRRKAWQISSYMIILGGVVATLAADTLLPSFLGALEDTSYGEYATNGWFSGGEGGSSVGRALVAVAPVAVAFFNRDRMKRLGHVGDVLTNIAFINAAILIVATYNWIFVRLTIYLMVYFFIFTTWVIFNAVKPSEKTTYVTAATIGFFLFYRTQSFQIALYMSDYFFPGRRLFRS